LWLAPLGLQDVDVVRKAIQQYRCQTFIAQRFGPLFEGQILGGGKNSETTQLTGQACKPSSCFLNENEPAPAKGGYFSHRTNMVYLHDRFDGSRIIWQPIREIEPYDVLLRTV
jgi:hypothetical protein